MADKAWLLYRNQYGRRFKNITIANAQALLAAGTVKKLFNIYVEKTQIAPLNLVKPVISGTVGSPNVLTCTAGTWGGKPTPTITYQWQRDAVDIAGATAATYTQAVADDTHQLSCKVTGTNDYGVAFVTVLGPTPVAPPGDEEPSAESTETLAKPVNVSLPTVEGLAEVGNTLTLNPGEWSGYPAPAFAFQWKLDSQPVEGETADGFTLTADMVGQVVTCTVVASNTEGTSQRTTAATSAVV